MNLHEHVFLKNLGNLSVPILQQRQEMPRSHLHVAERYVVAVLVSAGEVVTIHDQMMYAVESLAGYRRPKRARANYPTRAHHVAYHLENHLIRAIALGDRILQLINIVFSLGLPDRACTWLSVAENSHVKTTAVFAPLTALNSLLKSKRAERNIVVHRRRYSDTELHEIEGYFLLDRIGRDSGTEDPVVVQSRHNFKTMADRLIASRRSELRKFNDEASVHVSAIFSSLDPVVAARCSSRPPRSV